MPTLEDMIEETISTLHGHAADFPSTATLSGGITSSSASLTLDFGGVPWAGRPNGLVEVDDELILVSSYNDATGTAIVPPWGRGQRGTVAASHSANAMVTLRPRYPRAHVKRTLNSVIRESCPPLYRAQNLSVIQTGAIVEIGYPLPTNLIRVLRVEATDSLLSLDFANRRIVRHYEVRSVAGQQLLEIPKGEVYQDVLVTVATTPDNLVNPTDDFATVTGLPESAAGMVVFGAIARLILGPELAKQQASTVEASARGDKIQMGSATTVSRYYQALYTQRLQYVQDQLTQLYPPLLLRRG